MNLKTSFNKYGLGEVILACLGLVFLINVGNEVLVRDWEDFTLEAVGIMILFLCLGSLLLLAPMAILDMARKRLGLETKGGK